MTTQMRDELKEKIETNIKDLDGVLNGVRNKTTSISDASEYIVYAFEQIIGVPIPERDTLNRPKELDDYYVAWEDLKEEIQQRFEMFLKGEQLNE